MIRVPGLYWIDQNCLVYTNQQSVPIRHHRETSLGLRLELELSDHLSSRRPPHRPFVISLDAYFHSDDIHNVLRSWRYLSASCTSMCIHDKNDVEAIYCCWKSPAFSMYT